MPKINVHEIWLLKPAFDDETGEMVAEGLFHVLSPGGAARELKKRCDAEVEHAGKPLAGCSMYTQLILHWVNVCVDNNEPGIRAVSEDYLIIAGEREFVDLVEATWKEHEGALELSPNLKYDIMESVRETLEDRYGEISYTPEHLTPTEIELSKTLALGLVRKRRKPTVEPAPGETPEEHEPETEPINEPITEPETEPEPPGETTVKTEAEIRDEIEAKMKRA